MRDHFRIIRPLFAIVILATGWVCFAQVQEVPKVKAVPSVKKANEAVKPAIDAAKKPAEVNPLPGKAMDPKKSDAIDKEREALEAADEKSIRDSAEAFSLAYNSHDAKAIAKLFAIKAEVTDEMGNVLKGRDAIEQDFAETFTEFPESKIDIEISSIRFLTANIAVEEGTVRGHPVADEPENVSSYIAVHVKVDGDWAIASVRDFEVAAELTPGDRLNEISWLVGDWLEEGSNASITTACRWDETGNFLIQDYSLSLPGGPVSSGSVRIGWDALRGQIKSWTFSADGGHSEGYWTRDGDSWIVKFSGVNAKGEVTAATNAYRIVDPDTMTWTAYDRSVAGIQLDPLPEFIVKRHPPQPGI